MRRGCCGCRFCRWPALLPPPSWPFAAPGRLFFYLSGYDVGQAFVSPGTLLLGAMLEQAQAEGRTEVHFLRGRESYKYAWGAQDRMSRCGSFLRAERLCGADAAQAPELAGQLDRRSLR